MFVLKVSKVIICLSFLILAWSYRKNSEMEKSWILLAQKIRDYLGFELKDVWIQKSFNILTNFLFMAGISFLPNFELGGLVGAIALMLLTIAKVLKNPMYLSF